MAKKGRGRPSKTPRRLRETADQKLRRAMEALHKQDDGYADSWIDEAAAWGREGVYNGLALEADVRPGELHVDLGAGMMNLVHAIKRRTPDAVVLGVERNTRVVRHALYLMEALGISPHVCHSEFLCLDTRGNIRTVYDVHDDVISREDIADGRQIQFTSIKPHLADIDERFLSSDARIKIAIDDLREMRIVNKVLGERQIDSASMTFPGSGGRPAFEAPHAFPRKGKSVPDEVAIRRINQATQDAIAAGLKYLTERMRPGGRLLLAERVKDVGDEELMTIALAKTVLDRFGENFEAWNMMGIGLTGSLQKPAGPDWDAIGPELRNAPRVTMEDKVGFKFGVVKLEKTA